MKTNLILLLALLVQLVSQAQEIEKSNTLPKLPEDVSISYPHSNPLKAALKPVPETAVFEMDGYSLWDPSIIKVGDTYHLFCSRWKEEDGWDTWKKSYVIRATSNSLFGPYEFREVVIKGADHPWAKEGIHNPKITKVGDQFLLYHLGIPQWRTGFMFSESIEGPWEPLPKPALNTNNPSLMIREDESVYAVGKFKPSKKDTKDGRWDAYMQAFQAPDLLGPYTLLGDNKNRLPNNFELEDPTIWWANNQYNVICTDWEGKVTGEDKSVIYYTSKNGIDYVLYSQIPVWSRNEPIPLNDGNEIFPDKVERPQVYINENGELTALLVSITTQMKKERGIIVIRPIDRFVPDN